MSLRARLFLAFGLLVAALVAAQAALVRRLAADLSTELGEVAFSVGREVVSVFAYTHGATTTRHEERRVMVVDGSEAVAASGTANGPAPGEVVKRHVVAIPEVPVPAAGLPAGAQVTGTRVEVEQLEIRDGEGPDAARTVVFRVRGGDAPPAEEVALLMDPRTAAGSPRRLEVRGPQSTREIPVPAAGLERAVGRFRERLLLGSLALLAVGLVVAAGVAHGVTRPLRRLAAAAREVEAGHLGAQVGIRGGGEVGEAIAAFDRMSGRLATLDRTARELRERQHLAELGEVARGLAHSLRNPLHAVGLTVEELAARSGEDADGAAMAAAARAQIGRMDRSIRGLLALAAPGGSATEVDLGQLVADVALEALQDARGGVRLRVEPASDEGLRLRGVEAELRAVLQALVANAVEASPPAGEVVLTTSAAGADRDRVRIEVADRGPGVSPEVRPRLFEPHVTTKPTGSGMGLFLARRLAVARYRGSLVLADREGGGTLAVLELGHRREETGESVAESGG